MPVWKIDACGNHFNVYEEDSKKLIAGSMPNALYGAWAEIVRKANQSFEVQSATVETHQMVLKGLE